MSLFQAAEISPFSASHIGSLAWLSRYWIEYYVSVEMAADCKSLHFVEEGLTGGQILGGGVGGI